MAATVMLEEGLQVRSKSDAVIVDMFSNSLNGEIVTLLPSRRYIIP